MKNIFKVEIKYFSVMFLLSLIKIDTPLYLNFDDQFNQSF